MNSAVRAYINEFEKKRQNSKRIFMENKSQAER